LPKLRTKTGEEVGAIYGFIRTIGRIAKQFGPTHLAICWDSKPTLRLAIDTSYKANRPVTADELKAQITLSKELVEAWGLYNAKVESYEADDLMATLGTLAQNNGFEVVLVTSDKDMLQLVNDKIRVYLEHREELADPAKIRERFGFEAPQLTDYFALRGDAVDNIPGVPGIGEKTATQLISAFGSVEAILKASIDTESSLTPKIRAAIVSHQEQLLKNKTLVALERDVPIDFDEDAMIFNKNNFKPEFKDLLVRFGFASLLKEFGILATSDAGSSKYNAYFIAPENPEPLDIRTLGDPNVSKVAHDWKALLHQRPETLTQIKGMILDIKILAWINNPSEESYALDWLLTRYDCLNPIDLAMRLKEELERQGLWKLYEELELPLEHVLYRMEKTGISLAREVLEGLITEWDATLLTLHQDIIALAGAPRDLNINSPKQLGVLLFEKLNLPKYKKIKTGYSTDEEVLHRLKNAHPVVGKILEYRELSKLQSTYAKGLLETINPQTGRIHATFHQEGTQTGRLSCTNPNLQNIPIRSALGMKIRHAFAPLDPDWIFLSLDYSQIDLRVLAHLSADPNLIAAFEIGRDIHEETAKIIFEHQTETMLSPELRRRAKAINFGVLYGMSAWGLAKELEVSQEEAQNFIDLYYAGFPQVRVWMDATLAAARENGFVTTLLGRMRYLGNINSPQKALREFSERVAINTPVQGTSSDLIKIAMVRMALALETKQSRIRMLVQVHDEILLEGPKTEVLNSTSELRKIMEDAMQLKVPIVVHAKAGPNWQDLEPFGASS